MKYAIVTVGFLSSKGFEIQPHWRKSIDGTKVIIHYEMIEPSLDETDETDVYEYDSSDLSDILSSEEWTVKEEIAEVN